MISSKHGDRHEFTVAEAPVPHGWSRIDCLLGDEEQWTNPAVMTDPSQAIGGQGRARELRTISSDLAWPLAARAPRFGSPGALNNAELAARTAEGLLARPEHPRRHRRHPVPASCRPALTSSGMAEVLLFHHALGLTPGCLSFAEELRAAGHILHVPDLYEGRTFTELADGVGHAEQLGFGTLVERGRAYADGLAGDVVLAGFSLGVLPAQALAQTRPGARGALLMHGCVPPSEFAAPWPAGLPLQIHTMADDELGDVDLARQLVETITTAELFLYPGDRHLFADRSLPDHDVDAASLLTRRVLRFLDEIDR
jgi:dienelactone hydrolase